MRRLKILQIITGLGPGGAERLLVDMLKIFDSGRFDVRVASIKNDLRGLMIYSYPESKIDVFDIKNGPRVSEIIRLWKFTNDFSPDVIHAHMFHSLMLSYFLKYLGTGNTPKLVFTSHNSNHPGTHKFFIHMLRSLRDADIVFTCTQHQQINSKRVELIPNGVPVIPNLPERIAWNPNGPVRLLTVGRLVEQKDPIGLLRSFAKINRPNITLEYIGAGPLEGEIISLARQLGIADRVILHGLRSDIRDCMSRADIFVMHSNYEGMPMALLEAGAEGLPVLSTPVGSIPEVLADGRGWVAPPEKFSERLEFVIDNPLAAIVSGRQLHAHILSMHSIQKTALKHEYLYSDIAS